MQWDEQQLWSTYTMLTDLEAVFRSLKSELGIRPVYHQKTHRVEGHIFITLLAYNLVHQIVFYNEIGVKGNCRPKPALKQLYCSIITQV